MNTENYRIFLDSATTALSKSDGDIHCSLKQQDDIFTNENASNWRLRNSLFYTLQHLDENILKFENRFISSYSTTLWASTYDDVFDSINHIIKKHKASTVRLPNVKSSLIFRELGLKYYLRERKMKLDETGDLQFFSVDAIVVDTGMLFLSNQNNSTLDKINNSKVNVFFVTVDNIVANIVQLEQYRQLLSYSNDADKQDYIITKGSPNCQNYLFIIDNSRTNLLAHKKQRAALICTHCGKCNDVCPVVSLVGDEPYNNVFTGPIANVCLPYLETMETYKHVSYACTMCGRCESVCPLKIPIRDMILNTRHYLYANNVLEKNDRRLVKSYSSFFSSRKTMNMQRWRRKHRLLKYMSNDLLKTRKFPQFASHSFNKQYNDTKKKND